jgi:hypothetical protein
MPVLWMLQAKSTIPGPGKPVTSVNITFETVRMVSSADYCLLCWHLQAKNTIPGLGKPITSVDMTFDMTLTSHQL